MGDQEDQSSLTPPESSMSDNDGQPPAPPTSPTEGTHSETD